MNRIHCALICCAVLLSTVALADDSIEQMIAEGKFAEAVLGLEPLLIAAETSPEQERLCGGRNSFASPTTNSNYPTVPSEFRTVAIIQHPERLLN